MSKYKYVYVFKLAFLLQFNDIRNQENLKLWLTNFLREKANYHLKLSVNKLFNFSTPCLHYHLFQIIILMPLLIGLPT